MDATMTLSANELKKKSHILVDGQPYLVLDVQFATPTARGASTMVKARLRNLLSGLVQDKNFKTGEKFEEPDVEKIAVSFLYNTDAEEYYFMDNSIYDQFMLNAEKLGDQKYYLKEGFEFFALKYNGDVVSLELPPVVELRVIETEPAIKGASSSGRSTKRAILESGLEAQVPLYVETGTVVRVNTHSGEVTGRAAT